MRMTLELEPTLTLEAAIEQIAELNQEDISLKRQQLVRKFRIGAIVHRLDVPHGEREEALTEISIRSGVHINQIREWLRIYVHFNHNEKQFVEYLNSQDKPTEYALRDLISSSNRPEVLGDQRFAARMTHRFERFGHDLDQYNELIEKGVVDRNEAGALMGILFESMQTYRELSHIKPEHPKSNEYLQAVRELPCAITGQPGPSDPHHVETGGMGIKGSDYSCIPLSREVHRHIENNGHETSEQFFGVRFGDLIAQTMHKVLFGHNLVLPT